MLQPDDINVGDWIAVREAPNTAFDNIRGVALLVKAVDLPFVVCRFFSHPLTRTNVILDTSLCQLMRVTDMFVQAQLGSDLLAVAFNERQCDIYALAQAKALQQVPMLTQKEETAPEKDG
jgi:hypothetical protein